MRKIKKAIDWVLTPGNPFARSAENVYAVLSDVHGNLEALQAVVADAKRHNVGNYVCLGDIVGYNANPAECIDMIRKMKFKIVIKGNHDELASEDNDLSSFNPAATEAILWTRGRLGEDHKDWLKNLPLTAELDEKTCLVHGSLDNPEKWNYIQDDFGAAVHFAKQRHQICFNGHVHRPRCFVKGESINSIIFEEVVVEEGKQYLFNVGSVGQPRDKNPLAAYVLYYPEIGKVILKRVAYDIAKCQGKILAAGLPEKLANRLEFGK